MKKSEVLEIRKQFKESNCTISRICGCYVDSEKEVRTKFSDTFLTLPEEEILKYFEIFKKTLSGSIGKNLLNMEFQLNEEFKNESSEFLLKLKDSALNDEELISSFYEKIIENYEFSGNYLILLVHAAYDIPGIGNDNIELEDSSDEVYKYILCSICPVELSKPGLSYQPDENRIIQRNRDWVVGMPMNGFLFPAFTDRSSDVNNILYYSKKADSIHDELISGLLGCDTPLTADDQKFAFTTILEEVLGDDCDYESVRSIHENLNIMHEESKEDMRPSTIDKEELKSLLSESGISNEKVEILEKKIDEKENLQEGFHIANLVNTRNFEVKMPNISIKISPDSAHLLETKIIDGRKSIVIPITDEVEVNGVPVIVKD